MTSIVCPWTWISLLGGRLQTVQALCRKHSLTAYDAAYLEIAVREKNALATVDQDLRRASVAEGVELL